GLLDQGLIVIGPVGADLAQEIAKTCDSQNIGRDVLAQSRHVRLYDVLRSRPGGSISADSVAEGLELLLRYPDLSVAHLVILLVDHLSELFNQDFRGRFRHD